MIQYTSCKINIGLNVISKRSDNFHDIQTVFYPVKFLSDALEIVDSSNNQDVVEVTGLSINEPMEKNLCFKAIQLLRKDFDFPFVKLYLHKMVPMGAGLGGGSADATATLMLLNELYALNIETSQMIKYAAKLGSDCAFFVNDFPQLGQGRGEILSPVEVDLSGYFLLIVKPDIHISTADAYGRIKPNVDCFNLSDLPKLPISDWKNVIENDFENPIFNLHPQIGTLKNELYNHGAIYAQMSGSGAACYGIFKNRPNPLDVPIHWNQYIAEL